MSWEQLLDYATPKDWLIITFFYFFWPILFGLIYILIYKRLPIGNPIKDWRAIVDFFAEVAVTEPEVREKKKKKRVESPDDYWDGEVNYETGEVISDAGSRVRHPKNRDRAYSGSAERFHDGGGQDS